MRDWRKATNLGGRRRRSDGENPQLRFICFGNQSFSEQVEEEEEEERVLVFCGL